MRRLSITFKQYAASRLNNVDLSIFVFGLWFFVASIIIVMGTVILVATIAMATAVGVRMMKIAPVLVVVAIAPEMLPVVLL